MFFHLKNEFYQITHIQLKRMKDFLDGEDMLYAAKIVVWYHFNGLKMQKQSENIFSSK